MYEFIRLIRLLLWIGLLFSLVGGVLTASAFWIGQGSVGVIFIPGGVAIVLMTIDIPLRRKELVLESERNRTDLQRGFDVIPKNLHE